MRRPYGQPGDRLWVRETWQPLWKEAEVQPPYGLKSSEGWAVGYPATDGIQEYDDKWDGLVARCSPSIHMPRWASRILLEVVRVRVERLHSMKLEDYEAEGYLTKPTDVVEAVSLWEELGRPSREGLL